MKIDKPIPTRKTQRLGQAVIGSSHCTVNYIHGTDIYEILVNYDLVWASEGRNLDHETVCSIADAIVSTLDIMKAE